jgi:predicted ester cyclase
MPTTTEIVKAAVAALNAYDVAAIKTFWTPTGEERFPDAVCHGHDEIGRYFQEAFDAIRDLHVEPVAFAAEEDSVFMRSILSGTHTSGPFKGIAATGKRVNVRPRDGVTGVRRRLSAVRGHQS